MRDLLESLKNMASNNADTTNTNEIKFETELCELAYKYGTDKCPQIKHSYTPFYYEYLKDYRNTFKKVLEVGIGHTRKNWHNPQEISKEKFVPRLQNGASLRMWRDFFPNAEIFGADISPLALFEDERIKTYLCNEIEQKDVEKLINTIGSDIDLVIDDGSHHVDDQIALAKNLLPLLKKDVIYIIEDVGHSRHIKSALGDNYDYFMPDIPRIWHGGMILVIKNKNN